MDVIVVMVSKEVRRKAHFTFIIMLGDFYVDLYFPLEARTGLV